MVRTPRRRRSRSVNLILKPRGVIHPRVQAVGPEHFGIVSVDCAKARSKWMLADFYGSILVEPTVVEHTRAGFDAAIAQLRKALAARDIRDVLVAVERTGAYHQPVQRAFAAAGFEVRIVHPLATKQFRQPAHPGYKTDDTDLAAIHRAAVNGFALYEAPLESQWLELQLLVRHRRDLVHKASALCCQVREHLDAAMPGYAALFDDLWGSNVALFLVRQVGLARHILHAGVDEMAKMLTAAKVNFQRRSLTRVLAWATASAAPGELADRQRLIAVALDDDRRTKENQIRALESQIAIALVRTPYVRLLSICGINVVSAADYAGEMGPIARYANHRTITGRAGLRPARYQSDQVDRPDGKLVRSANRRLRYAILQIADNLIACNDYFAARSAAWRTAGKDARHCRVRVGSTFVRISYHLLAAPNVFQHPSAQGRDYILKKLLAFYAGHATPLPQRRSDLLAAIEQLPPRAYVDEARPLAQELKMIQEGRHRGPQPIGEILPEVLARLRIAALQSQASGAGDPA